MGSRRKRWAPGLFLEYFYFIVIADNNIRAGTHHAQIVRRKGVDLLTGIEHHRHAELGAFAQVPLHHAGVSGGDGGDSGIFRFNSLCNARCFFRWRAGKESRYLVIFFVRNDVGRRRVILCVACDISGFDFSAGEVCEIVRTVRAECADNNRRAAEQLYGVSDVACGAAARSDEPIHDEAQVEHAIIAAARADVIFKIAGIVHDAVVHKRTGDKNWFHGDYCFIDLFILLS